MQIFNETDWYCQHETVQQLSNQTAENEELRGTMETVLEAGSFIVQGSPVLCNGQKP